MHRFLPVLVKLFKARPNVKCTRSTFVFENKGSDQLRYTDSTIPLFLKSKCACHYSASVIVQAGLCRTWSETQIVGFLMRKLIYDIRKICPCNVYPLEPHFYIAKLGFAGVYLFFLFLLQNIDCGYTLEPPRRGGSNVYPQSMF